MEDSDRPPQLNNALGDRSKASAPSNAEAPGALSHQRPLGAQPLPAGSLASSKPGMRAASSPQKSTGDTIVTVYDSILPKPPLNVARAGGRGAVPSAAPPVRSLSQQRAGQPVQPRFSGGANALAATAPPPQGYGAVRIAAPPARGMSQQRAMQPRVDGGPRAATSTHQGSPTKQGGPAPQQPYSTVATLTLNIKNMILSISTSRKQPRPEPPLAELYWRLLQYVQLASALFKCSPDTTEQLLIQKLLEVVAHFVDTELPECPAAGGGAGDASLFDIRHLLRTTVGAGSGPGTTPVRKVAAVKVRACASAEVQPAMAAPVPVYASPTSNYSALAAAAAAAERSSPKRSCISPPRAASRSTSPKAVRFAEHTMQSDNVCRMLSFSDASSSSSSADGNVACTSSPSGNPGGSPLSASKDALPCPFLLHSFTFPRSSAMPV